MASGDVKSWVEEQIANHKVLVFSKSHCPYCTMAKDALKSQNIPFTVLELEDRPDCDEVQDVLAKMTGARTVPRVFIKGKCIGGGTDTKALANSGKLQAMIG